jgi:hypothetical protein
MTRALPIDILRNALKPYLGPFTSAHAVQLAAKTTFGTVLEHVTPSDVPMLLEALGPMLRTLLGKESAERLAAQISKELRNE